MGIKQILFPTDFSSCSDNALHYTTNLAYKLKADVVLMHSYGFPDEYSAIPAAQILSMKDSLKKEVEGQMQKLIHSSTELAPDIHMSYEVELGFFTEHLLAQIKRKNIDLVALGTRGAKGLAPVFFGTNTSSVIDQSICPVLIIPQGAPYRPVKNIMYLSKNKKEEIGHLKYLSSIATKVFGAMIYVIHISGDPDISVDNYFVESVSQEIGYSLISFRCIKWKHISHCLEEFAEKEGMDWIVMNVGHRNSFERVFGPNLTKEVAYHSKIPLFVFPEKFVI